MRVFLPPSLSQRGSVLRGGTLSGILRMKTGGACPPLRKDQGRSWKTAGAQKRARWSHRPPLFCQGRRDTLVGYARQLNTPAAAAQTGGWVSSIPPPDAGAMPKARVSRIGVRGKADCGTQAERMWSRGPAGSVTRRRFACFAAGGKVGRPAGRNPPTNPMTETETGVRRPLIRRGIRRDTFPLWGKALCWPTAYFVEPITMKK